MKVAVYTPPLILAGRALVGAGIAAAAESSTSLPSGCETSTGSTSAASSTSSGSSSSGCSSPLDALLADLSLLSGIPASGRNEEDRKIAKAIASLTDATDASGWTDGGFALTSSRGKQVFEDLKHALDQLSSSHSSNGTIAAVAADILTQAGTVANYAVTHATLDAKHAAKAQRELDKGAQQASAGRATAALESYAHAWEIAAGKGGDDGGDD